ncbi:GreA/GreB family elongation factor [Dongia sp.]|uniref:GreA/GreB family elongation factor n=1 Tax=Dongia sp. TaxID=1977262 RepID=UPI003750CDC1
MSRAFVKENEDQVPELPERPQSPHPNFVTPRGLALLKQQLAELEDSKHRHQTERDLLDKEALQVIERDLRYVQERLTRAIPVDYDQQPKDQVDFGAIVETEDENGKKRKFEIVGEDEADPTVGKLSWVSPLALALKDAKTGDSVIWKRPAGDLELEILSIRYPAG